MFTACVSCDRDLGRNDELPGLSVGRRIAFDTESGRLWVICPHCEEWNLGLLETRWEAVAAAEKLAKKAEARVSVGAMGLVRTAKGLELLRIGGVPKTDIANWRYGRVVERRRRWSHATIAVLGVLVAALGAWATQVGDSVAVGLYLSGLLSAAVYWVFRRAPSLAVWGRTSGGRRWFAWGFRLENVRVDLKQRDGEPVLIVPGLFGELQYVGLEAMEVLAQMIARRSWAALHETDVPAAVKLVDRTEDRLGPTRARNAWRKLAADSFGGFAMVMPVTDQLALEMALREEIERLAMETKARAARDVWPAAQEVGRISDDLLLPRRILDWIRARRR